MKVKTREDALLHCFDLWLWLALNPEKTKKVWPGWEFNGGYLARCVNTCPCCEYDKQFEDAHCDNCPIRWNGNNGCLGKCEYTSWVRAKTPEEKTKWALKIAELALDAL